MNAGGLERKMDIGQYAAKWREKARQVGGLQAYLQQGGKKTKKVAGVKREASSSGAAQEGDLKRSKTR